MGYEKEAALGRSGGRHFRKDQQSKHPVLATVSASKELEKGQCVYHSEGGGKWPDPFATYRPRQRVSLV